MEGGADSFDLGGLVRDVVATACVAVDLLEEQVEGLYRVAIEDPQGEGAPVDVFVAPDGMAVVNVAEGGARIELPLDRPSGRAEFKAVLHAILTGDVKEKVDGRGSQVWIKDRHQQEVAHLVARKGILPVPAGKGIVTNYRSYSPTQ